MQMPNELQRLLRAADAAGPGERIEYRDRIAAFGVAAVPLLQQWLQDARLGGFAVRTLERIAQTPAARGAVVDAFFARDPEELPATTARDIEAALAHLRGRSTRRAAAPRAKPTPDPWPGSRPVTALELRFHDDMLEIFTLAGEATRRVRPDGSIQRGYWASYFLRGVRNHGGVTYAHQLLRQPGTTDGFQRLKEEEKLELTMEALVLRPEYVTLFSGEERRIAAHRLAEGGYQPPKD